jgi:hypothetical protein
MVVVEEHPRFGAFRGRAVLGGIRLNEVGDRWDRGIDGFIERAVDAQRYGETDGVNGRVPLLIAHERCRCRCRQRAALPAPDHLTAAEKRGERRERSHHPQRASAHRVIGAGL